MHRQAHNLLSKNPLLVAEERAQLNAAELGRIAALWRSSDPRIGFRRGRSCRFQVTGLKRTSIIVNPSPPPWLTELAESVANCMHAHDVLSPVGCHFQEVGDVQEVIVFASRTEVLGGPCDGKRLPSRFTLDVAGLLEMFTSIEAIEWQALKHDAKDEVGANLAIMGTYHGERICLRVPAEAPQRFEAGRIANVYERRFINVW